jgi:dihydropyrimidinase
MTFDLVVQGGQVVTASQVTCADVGINDGKIAAVGIDLLGREYFNAQGKLVLPGAVDPHVHLEMPTASTITSDDWVSGTRAAAYGGVTTVIDFVEPELGQPLLDALAERRAQAEGRAWVDYALHMTLIDATGSTLPQIPAVITAGVNSFKVYTTYSGFALSDEELLASFEAVCAAGGLVMVHAENDSILRYSLAHLRAAGRLAPRDYPLSRPAIAEVEAIQRVILLAHLTGVPLYIVHISTEQGATALETALQQGQVIFGETCPQYLLLDESRYQHTDPRESLKYLCAPPLRRTADQQTLWRCLQAGVIQTIGTDHCAFNIQGQKDRGLDSFTECPGGLPGIESRLALLYTFGVRAGWLTPQQWVSCCCTSPAQIFGLYPRKGSLEVGADADLVVFDPNHSLTLTPLCLHENVDYTPYEGLSLHGWPVATILSGRLVACLEDAQRDKETHPAGKFIPAGSGLAHYRNST